jgi:hypothetical protein
MAETLKPNGHLPPRSLPKPWADLSLREKAEIYLSTEHIGNAEWKVLVREMLAHGLFGDDDPLEIDWRKFRGMR